MTAFHGFIVPSTESSRTKEKMIKMNIQHRTLNFEHRIMTASKISKLVIIGLAQANQYRV